MSRIFLQERKSPKISSAINSPKGLPGFRICTHRPVPKSELLPQILAPSSLTSSVVWNPLMARGPLMISLCVTWGAGMNFSRCATRERRGGKIPMAIHVNQVYFWNNTRKRNHLVCSPLGAESLIGFATRADGFCVGVCWGSKNRKTAAEALCSDRSVTNFYLLFSLHPSWRLRRSIRPKSCTPTGWHPGLYSNDDQTPSGWMLQRRKKVLLNALN